MNLLKLLDIYNHIDLINTDVALSKCSIEYNGVTTQNKNGFRQSEKLTRFINFETVCDCSTSAVIQKTIGVSELCESLGRVRITLDLDKHVIYVL